MEKLIWTGLEEKAFKPYKTWINKGSPGICGSYCAAVLTHVTVLRDTNHWMAKQDLINAFKKGFNIKNLLNLSNIHTKISRFII